MASTRGLDTASQCDRTTGVSDRTKLPVISEKPALEDRAHRRITYVRVSLTDRCNFRCTYCMPAEGMKFVPRDEVLHFEEIVRLARVFAGLGVRRIRLTGGEPTVRRGVVDLVAALREVEGIDELVMTSNGHLLGQLAAPLARAGLVAVNVSLDTLRPDRFRALTRRGDLAPVIAGIDAALAAGLRVKLNAVALRGENDDEIAALCAFGWERGVTPRFIEHMPMSEGMIYQRTAHLSAAEIRERVRGSFGAELEAEGETATAGPARYWRLLPDGARRFGIISAMTEHFCSTCNRVRLSAIGELHTCLGYDDATDLRSILRDGGSDDDLRQAIAAAVAGKRDGHGFDLSGAGGPRKHMISIGG